MNQKGQVVVTVMVMIVAAIVGVTVLNSITSGFCEGCVAQDSFTDYNVTSDPVPVWENHTCIGDKCDTDYELTCNGTVQEVGVDYSISDCDYRLENAALNNTTCVLDYTAVTSSTNDSGIFGTIVCLLPVLAALGIMVLAITWAVLK